jgi:hypothetical protein
MDGACLTPHLVQFGSVPNGFRARVHVAQTARGKFHSRLFARLKQPQAGEPEWRNNDKPRRSRRIEREKHGSEDH